MQASDTCYCTIQMTMYIENHLLAQAQNCLLKHNKSSGIGTKVCFQFHTSVIIFSPLEPVEGCLGLWGLSYQNEVSSGNSHNTEYITTPFKDNSWTYDRVPCVICMNHPYTVAVSLAHTTLGVSLLWLLCAVTLTMPSCFVRAILTQPQSAKQALWFCCTLLLV